MSSHDNLARAYRRDTSLSPTAQDEPIRTLIVDDEAIVVETLSEALLLDGYEVYSASSIKDTMEMLERITFDVILADVFLADGTGFELMKRIHAVYPELPIIMITGQGDKAMAREAMNAGAVDFVSKPCQVHELPIIIERNLARQTMASRRALSYTKEIQSSYETVLDALLSALDTRDTETEGHSERVTAYAMLLADQLGVAQGELYHLERGALLHDIGKIGIPDRILLKPGPLTAEEWVEMKKHPIIGYRMCARIPFLSGAAQIVLHHHERWDGMGYPQGLAGENIPLGSRVFAVVDTFDAMTTDRPYRTALSFDTCSAEIVKHRGTQFDPQVVDAFLTVAEPHWKTICVTARR